MGQPTALKGHDEEKAPPSPPAQAGPRVCEGRQRKTRPSHLWPRCSPLPLLTLVTPTADFFTDYCSGLGRNYKSLLLQKFDSRNCSHATTP